MDHIVLGHRPCTVVLSDICHSAMDAFYKVGDHDLSGPGTYYTVKYIVPLNILYCETNHVIQSSVDMLYRAVDHGLPAREP